MFMNLIKGRFFRENVRLNDTRNELISPQYILIILQQKSMRFSADIRSMA